jgi:hypothetical protein
MSYENPTQILDTSLTQVVKGLDQNRAMLLAQVEARKKEVRASQKANLKQQKQEEKEKRARNVREGKIRKGIDDNVAKFNSKFSDEYLTINDGTTPFVADENGIVTLDRIEITKDQLEQDYEAYQAALLKDPNASLQDINPIYEQGFDIETIYNEEVGGPLVDIKAEIETYWKAMAEVDEGSEEYMQYKKNIDDILRQAPGFVSILNTTVEGTSTAWDYDGNIIKPEANMPGLILYDGQPDFEIRQEAAKMIHLKQKQGRFKYVFKDGKSYMEYTSPTSYNGKNKLLIEEEAYMNAVRNGDMGGLINVTDASFLEEVVETVFDDGTENQYKKLVTTSNLSETATDEEKKKVVRQRIKNYDNANKLLQTKVDAFIDSKGLASNYNPNLIQSNWQMLGGPDENETGGETVYEGTPEQIARAKKLLYEHVKRTKGGDTGIIGNGVTETILNEVENEDAIDLARGEGIKLNVKELNEYLPNLQKTASGTDGKAGYSYDNLYANFKSLKANNGKGVLAVLNSGGNGDYISGAQLKTKYPSIDLSDIDDAQLYVYKSGSNKPTKVNPKVLKDFDIFLNEVNKSNSSITNKSHNAALKLIDRDQEIARLESDGDSNLPPLPGMA